MAELIRINDLAHPVLSDLQQAARDYADANPVELTVQAVLKSARDATGLEDFGPQDFLQRLGILCDEWTGDPELTQLGKLSLFNKLTQHARSRLLIQDALRKHPEIEQVRLQTPLIVVGLPRSGTTHLLNLMAADSRLRALPLWESYEPVPTPGEWAKDGVDPRYRRCDEQWQAMQAMSPLLAAMHPMNPDHIHEELELMGPDFASYNYEWLAVSPRWRDHYYSQDQTPHYEYMRTVLKLLTWQDGDHSGDHTRWVLKCPQHLEQLPVLRRVFPDATIVMTHRDPVSVIQSAVTMLAYGQRISRTRVDTAGLIAYWSDRIAHLLEACVRDADAIPSTQKIDVLFHQFMADDMAVVEEIYTRAGLELTAPTRSELRAYLDHHPRGKHGQVVYDLKGDFGVEPEQLRARFGFYFERYPVRAEVD
ncbi:MAG: sulfotransferase [Pseudomonadota bacterium]